MLIEVTFQNLMIFIGFALGIAVGILLLNILWNIKKMIGVLRPMVEVNKDFINKAFKTMPEVLDNIVQISDNVRDTTDKLKVSVPVILQEAESVTSTAKESIELASAVIENMGSGINEAVAGYKKDTPDYMSYINIFKEVMQIIYRAFSSSK